MMRGPFENEPGTDFTIEANRERMRAALSVVGAQLGQRYPIVVGGERREPGRWIESRNPGDPDQLVGSVAKATPRDAHDAMAAATAAFAAWKRVAPEGRASVLFKMAGLMRQRKFELAAWMVYELDKAWDEADGEVCEAIDMLEWNGREMLRLSLPAPLANLPDEANRLVYQGIGVGVVIPPWNFPCAIYTNMVMAAVVTGNAVIVKPASNTPVIGYKVFELMEAAGVPAGVVNFLPGSGGEIGDLLVDHPQTRFVAFTGSKEVGIRIFERGAKVQPGQRWLKRITAEMGGKDAIIVAADADLDEAATGIVTAAFGFSGQKCSACSLAIIDASVYDDVVERIVERTRSAVSVGSALTGDHTVGAVVDRSQYDSILGYIEVGKGEGRLAHGGQAVEGAGYYIEPTIFVDVDPSARIVREEIFGPVLAIVKARDFDHALEVANASEYGLTGSVYSRDRVKLERAVHEFDVGNLYLNRKCTGAMMGVHPFGGVKMSGTNTKSGGPDYLVNFMEAKAVGEKLY
jgi:1-pyrroline-5-carboxylate dehydrogenase